MDGLFNELWKGKDVISVDHCVEITLPVSTILSWVLAILTHDI